MKYFTLLCPQKEKWFKNIFLIQIPNAEFVGKMKKNLSWSFALNLIASNRNYVHATHLMILQLTHYCFSLSLDSAKPLPFWFCIRRNKNRLITNIFLTETKEGENMLMDTDQSGTMVAPIRKVRTKYKSALHLITYITQKINTL